MEKLSLINKQFIKAVQNNQIDELKSLLDQGADIHTDNDHAFRSSAERGRLEIVKLLLTHDANIHANDDDALKNAASGNNNDVWQVLSAFIREEKLLVAASDSNGAGICLRATETTSLPQTQVLAIGSTSMPRQLVNNINVKTIKNRHIKFNNI